MSELPQHLEIASQPTSHGWRWIRSAFDLFKEQPFLWIGILLVIWIILAVISWVPLIGYFAVNLLQPVLAAGLYLTADKESQDPPAQFGQMFDGFKTNFNQLMMLGLVYLIAMVVLMIPFLLTFAAIVGDSNLESYSQSFSDGTLDIQQFQTVMQSNPDMMSLLLAVMVGLLFYIPLLMSYYFAPVLIAVENMNCFEAMKTSFVACIRNVMPFLWFSIIATALVVIASIPFFLGLILAIPLLALTTYTAYVDIFHATDNIPPAENTTSAL
ncbi:Uncharacterised protein [BD1-7 clade bacterium]|uniref:Transmembrane protein n=1 Tax=BD1-7 clade bacterium TaxID=2029982 RepID=A0A5S9PU04_9GAMM|nr:Uncharacterised protein [BD1-7 clade bacterium]